MVKETGLTHMEKGFTVFAKVGIPDSATSMKAILKTSLFSGLPKQLHGAFNLNTYGKMTIDLGLDPSQTLPLLDTFAGSLGVLELKAFKFTFEINLASSSASIGMYGQLQVTDTILKGPPFLFPGLAAKFSFKDGGVQALMAIGVEKFVLLPDPEYPVYIGPIVLGMTWDSTKDTPFAVAFSGELRLNIFGNFMYALCRPIPLLEPLAKILGVMTNFLVGGFVIEIRASTVDHMAFQIGSTKHDIRGAGLSMALALRMSDAMKVIGLPPLTIFAEGPSHNPNWKSMRHVHERPRTISTNPG